MTYPAQSRIGLVVQALALAAALAAGACGPKKLPPPAAAAAPAYPAFERPELIEPLPAPLPPAVSLRYDEGWTRLQAGQPEQASAAFTEVIRSIAGVLPGARGARLCAPGGARRRRRRGQLRRARWPPGRAMCPRSPAVPKRSSPATVASRRSPRSRR